MNEGGVNEAWGSLTVGGEAVRYRLVALSINRVASLGGIVAVAVAVVAAAIAIAPERVGSAVLGGLFSAFSCVYGEGARREEEAARVVDAPPLHPQKLETPPYGAQVANALRHHPVQYQDGDGGEQRQVHPRAVTQRVPAREERQGPVVAPGRRSGDGGGAPPWRTRLDRPFREGVVPLRGGRGVVVSEEAAGDGSALQRR